MWKIFKYSFFDLLRSRWTYFYFLFFMIVTAGLLHLSGQVAAAITSLLNIVVVLIPLISTLYGIVYFYNSSEFTELLLAQPVRRRSIFLGQYLGLFTSLAASFLLGILIPAILLGHFEVRLWLDLFYLLGIGTLLTAIFTAIAFLIALRQTNRMKGFAIAILTWLFLAVLYDGLFIIFLLFFEDYPLEKFSLIATVLNPIDLSRTSLLLKLDMAALMGYTGAVFNKFFGTSMGMLVSISALVLWVAGPLLGFLRVAARKDF
ncbi:MAG: ABC transporter permease [Imperialibacter sp.]|uniref:ABC transporter permease n=1 Tax=Imperialibacter sp. TaxID=2038411 RepID=UPI003A84248F